MFEICFEKERAAYAFRSAPAQKRRPAPVTMTTLDIPELSEGMEIDRNDDAPQ
jgi:hypothetical protein